MLSFNVALTLGLSAIQKEVDRLFGVRQFITNHLGDLPEPRGPSASSSSTPDSETSCTGSPECLSRGCIDLLLVHPPPRHFAGVCAPRQGGAVCGGEERVWTCRCVSTYIPLGLEWLIRSSFDFYPNNSIKTFVVLTFTKDLGEQYGSLNNPKQSFK